MFCSVEIGWLDKNVCLLYKKKAIPNPHAGRPEWCTAMSVMVAFDKCTGSKVDYQRTYQRAYRLLKKHPK
jgi:hypothetical protein